MYSAVYEKTQMVSAVIGAASVGLEFNFEDVPNISRNDIEIYGIQAFSDGQLAADEQGRTVIAAADAVNLTVTLEDNEKRVHLQDVPYYSLISSQNGGFTALVKPFVLNLTQCRIKINAAGTLAADQVAVFNILYREI